MNWYQGRASEAQSGRVPTVGHRTSKPGRRGSRVILAMGALVATLLGTALAAPGVAGASSPADQGVTAKSISVGIPYVNFAALASLGVKIDEGNIPDAYNALIANMNAHGGVDGRKLVPYFAEMNPALPADAVSSCTALTEDDHVFVAMEPVYPDCYEQDHDTPVIAGSLPGTLPSGSAPDFTLLPPDEAYDPLQLAAFDKRGAFKGKKVGIFYASGSDADEVRVVQSDLKKLHVNVVLTAEDSAPATDAVASDQQVKTIAVKFQDAGVNEVIGVGGSGSTTWPKALLDNQSTYKPPWIATSEASLIASVQSAKGQNPYMDNVLTSTAVPSFYQMWKDPAVQKCVAVVRKAHPSDTIDAPVNPASPNATASGADVTYAGVVEACQYLAIFAKIAAAAGKHLTVASFTKAGYGLRNVTFPGSDGPVSFAPNQAYAIGRVNIVTYDPTSKNLVALPSSSSN